jgi:TRAP-type C4-dicarboxylate transport system substrate-binding protein
MSGIRGRVGAGVVVLLLVVSGAVPAARAQGPTTVKLATLAPNGSAWHELLKEMGARWAEASGGQVVLRIYPDGVAGDEPDVIRKIRIGQLQAGSLTNAGGLNRINPAVYALSIPMNATSWEAHLRVRKALEPKLEALLAEDGFVVLNWGDVGWARFFLPSPDPSVETVKKYRMFTWVGDPTAELWQRAGFRLIPLQTTDILTGLQTKLVDAFSTTPLVALANQWFPFDPYMVDMPWAPLVGATIIDRKVWEQIPEELRSRLMAIAREFGDQLQAEVLRMEEAAIKAMQERGLQVVVPTDQQRDNWRDALRAGYPQVRGSLIPADLFDEALRAAAGGR